MQLCWHWASLICARIQNTMFFLKRKDFLPKFSQVSLFVSSCLIFAFEVYNVRQYTSSYTALFCTHVNTCVQNTKQKGTTVKCWVARPLHLDGDWGSPLQAKGAPFQSYCLSPVPVVPHVFLPTSHTLTGSYFASRPTTPRFPFMPVDPLAAAIASVSITRCVLIT